MDIEEVIHEIMPKVRELEKECSNLTPEGFDDTRETIINEVRKHGNQKVTVIMQSVFEIIEENLKHERLRKQYALIRNNRCDIPYMEIMEIREMIKKEYPSSHPDFWLWNMFAVGFAYGKRAERARRKKHVQREGLGA